MSIHAFHNVFVRLEPTDRLLSYYTKVQLTPGAWIAKEHCTTRSLYHTRVPTATFRH
jgi:hypothetical protein